MTMPEKSLRENGRSLRDPVPSLDELRPMGSVNPGKMRPPSLGAAFPTGDGPVKYRSKVRNVVAYGSRYCRGVELFGLAGSSAGFAGKSRKEKE